MLVGIGVVVARTLGCHPHVETKVFHGPVLVLLRWGHQHNAPLSLDLSSAHSLAPRLLDFLHLILVKPAMSRPKNRKMLKPGSFALPVASRVRFAQRRPQELVVIQRCAEPARVPLPSSPSLPAEEPCFAKIPLLAPGEGLESRTRPRRRFRS